MKNAGMPLSTESRKTFTEVSPPTRLAYLSLIDFVPDHRTYEYLTRRRHHACGRSHAGRHERRPDAR